jgi:hypothetical protein
MGPQRRLGIYVGFDSPSIIRYLEPLTGDVFKARFEDCHFNETVFPPLGGEKSLPEARREINWNVSTLSNFDPRTNQCELEVQRIIHLQGIANQLPDVFTDSKKIVKSHIPAANIPARIEVLEGKLINITANESKARLKRGRPVGAKDKIPRKKKTQENQVAAPEEAIPIKQANEIVDLSKTCAQKSPENRPPEEVSPEELSPEKEQVPENNEISIHYVSTEKYWIEIKLLSTTYFHLKLLLTLPEVMMMKLNHKPSKNVDVEMIGQCGKKQFKQS